MGTFPFLLVCLFSVNVLLEWNKTRAVRCTNTWTTVLDWLVCQREVSQIEANHLRLDFDLLMKIERKKQRVMILHS